MSRGVQIRVVFHQVQAAKETTPTMRKQTPIRPDGVTRTLLPIHQQPRSVDIPTMVIQIS